MSESRKHTQPSLFSKSSSDISSSKATADDGLFAGSSRPSRLLNGETTASAKCATPLGSSSLAKKFLGSLTPQLEPFVAPPAEPESETPPLPPTPPPPAPTRPSNSGAKESTVKESAFKRRPVTFHKSSPKTYATKFGAPSAKESAESAADKKTTPSPTSSSNSSDTSANSSPTHAASKNNKVNIIKLEVVNSAKKQAAKNGSELPPQSPTDKSSSNAKPPLPPSSSQTTTTTTSPSSWRSKLRSIYSEQPVLDVAAAAPQEKSLVGALGQARPSKPNHASSGDAKPPPPTSAKPVSRIIPLEVKNSKAGASKPAQAGLSTRYIFFYHHGIPKYPVFLDWVLNSKKKIGFSTKSMRKFNILIWCIYSNSSRIYSTVY